MVSTEILRVPSLALFHQITMKRFCKLFGLSLVCVSTSAAQTHSTSQPATTQSAFSITLHRPSHVGDRASFEIVQSELQSSKSEWIDGDGPTKTGQQAYTGHLITDEVVTKTDKNNYAIQKQYHIKLFTVLNEPGKEFPLLSPGTVIVAKAIGKMGEFTINGKPPAADLNHWLMSLFVSPAPEYSTHEDLRFGINIPRHLGEKWSINAQAVADTYHRRGYSLDSRNIQGDVKLVDAETYNGIPCLRLETTFTTRDFFPLTAATKPSRTTNQGTNTETRHIIYLVAMTGDRGILWEDFNEIYRYEWSGKSWGRAYTQVWEKDEERFSRRLDLDRLSATLTQAEHKSR